MFGFNLLYADIHNDSLVKKQYPYKYYVTYSDMRSTHRNHFRGSNLLVSKNISKNYALGIGTEYSYSALHGDNGYNLYDVTFVPIFFDIRYTLYSKKKFDWLLTADPGISFGSYRKEYQNNLGLKTKTSQKGLYIFIGTGIQYKISKHISPLLEVGFKGYKMSFNNLDINPHGLTLRTGLIIQ